MIISESYMPKNLVDKLIEGLNESKSISNFVTLENLPIADNYIVTLSIEPTKLDKDEWIIDRLAKQE